MEMLGSKRYNLSKTFKKINKKNKNGKKIY